MLHPHLLTTLLVLGALTAAAPAQLGAVRRWGGQRAVHQLYTEARTVVVGTVIESSPWEHVARRDAPTDSRQFRLVIDEVVRGAWTDDEVELELWRYGQDLDLSAGQPVLCFLDRDRDGEPELVGPLEPTIAVGSRQVLAYRVAFRALDELLRDRAGTTRRRALVDWVVSCIEQAPTRHLGLHDLRQGADRPTGSPINQQLSAEHQQRLVALLATGELSTVEESELLRAVDGPWVAALRPALVASLRATPLADPDRVWTPADQDLLLRRLDVLAQQRRLAGEDGRGWPGRRGELHDQLREPHAPESAPWQDAAAAAALVAEVLGPPAPDER